MSILKLSNRHYSKKLSGFINNLLADVLAIGILLIAYNYGRLLLSSPEWILFDKYEFWLKIIILFSVIAFIAYDVVAYKIHMEVQEKIPVTVNANNVNWNSTIALFLLDIFRVCVSAWLLSTIAISEIGKADLIQGNAKEIIQDIICIEIKTFYLLLIFYSLWHLTMLVWYSVEGPDNKQNKKFHATRILINLVVIMLIFGASFLFDFNSESHSEPESKINYAKIILNVLMTIYFVGYVVTIYKGRVVEFLKEDLNFMSYQSK